MTDVIERLKAQNAAANKAAQDIDSSNTEQITAADIQVGDVITTLGKVVFPFPVTMSKVTVVGGYGLVMLFGTNGWFSGRPVRLAESATRVIL